MAMKVETRRSMDRISNLPDTILCHILSFLPTKEVVRNSILSTWWKYLFASLTNFDFVYSLLSHTQQKGNEKSGRNISSFMNFVDRVLLLHNASCIDRFRLECVEDIVDSSRLNAWVCATLWRNVQEFNLCFSVKESSMLPGELFTSKTLVVLKLIIQYVLNVPAKVCLPSFKILHLESIDFSDNVSIKRLFSSCLVLEALVLECCGWENIRKFNISSHTLKRLTIRNDYTTESCSYEILVDAPRLVYLRFSDYVADGYSLTNLYSLVEAHIDVTLSLEQRGDFDEHYAVTEFVRGISNVQSLYISFSSVEAIQLCCHTLPVFHNMLSQVLPDFLKGSPNLKTLVFESGECREDWNPPEDVPSCLLFHLKEIEILYFKGQEQELKMVKYCLKNANALKKLTIRTTANEKEQLEITNKLLKLRRGSKKCRVTIHILPRSRIYGLPFVSL